MSSIKALKKKISKRAKQKKNIQVKNSIRLKNAKQAENAAEAIVEMSTEGTNTTAAAESQISEAPATETSHH